METTKIFLLLLLIASTLVAQTKSLKILLDDGTERHYPIGKVTKLTFVEDACNGVTKVIYEGKTYNTVQIGNQCWFRENLDVDTSSIGDSLQTNKSTIQKYCYNKDEQYCRIYGGLYKWNEAMQYVTTAGAQGICPSGWHIPTRTEFEVLIGYIGDQAAILVSESQKTINYTANNNTGFSAMFAGRYYETFDDLNYFTYFWSSTDNGKGADFVDLRYDSSHITLYGGSKENAFSIRCLKD